MSKNNSHMDTQRPYGTWPSAITAELLVGDSIRLGEPRFDGDYIYWLESRPLERGRTTIARTRISDTTKHIEDILPYPINTRTKAHEYGGASYCVSNGIVYFVLADDQCIYRLDTRAAKSQPEAITQESGQHYADLIIDEKRQRLICVCEDTGNNTQEPSSSLIAIELAEPFQQHTLASGQDFYSSPNLSPDGQHLTWLTWQHPNMPWDHTQCSIARVESNGTLDCIKTIAGDKQAESIFQPQWSPAGELFLVSDRNNWWNIYRYDDAQDSLENICEMNAEFATPQWVFGMSTYGFINTDTIICTYTENGNWYLLKLNTTDKTRQVIPVPFSYITSIHCSKKGALWLGASPTDAEQIVFCDNVSLGRVHISKANCQSIKTSATNTLSPDWFSKPEALTFPTSNGQSAYGFFYSPCNPDVEPLNETKPPLIVLCHGGPTGATSSALNLKIQYWTSRGFAVLDVNYRGSTGYGRAFRNALHKQWGIADVEDVCAGAQYLAESNRVNKEQLIIKGSSAGGYTVLAALTFTDTFTLGTSLYGIGNLETLAKDTHKFESRYLDSLIGPYPEEKALYQQRSPINHINQLNCPVLFFQGLEDKVVPPAQAKAMVTALREKNIPVEYVEFHNEGHGFRQADNIIRMLETEQDFYQRQLGIKEQ